jgi:hypothetical protein
MGLTAGDLFAKKIVKSAPRARLFLELLQVNEVDDSYLPVIEKAESICIANNWKDKQQIAQALQQACEELESHPNQVSENHGLFSDFLQNSESSIDSEAQIVAAQIYDKLLSSTQNYVITRNFTNPVAKQIKERAEAKFRNFLGTVSSATATIKAVQANTALAAIEPAKE